jgi:hypothetical protein
MSKLSATVLVKISEWVDAGNAHRDPEAQMWGRVSKVAEEAGESIAALVGYTGQNPRKGVTHQRDDVIEELLDVAVAALGAIEHIVGHDGLTLDRLDQKIFKVGKRAGVFGLDDERVGPVSETPAVCSWCSRSHDCRIRPHCHHPDGHSLRCNTYDADGHP